MKNEIACAITALLATTSAFAGDHDPKQIAALLSTSKVSLLAGIQSAEETSGAATSAKYEVEDGKLMLSVYTVPEGLSIEPEKATLTELSGAASDGTQGLKPEVFTDKEHIARASVHMTMFQLSKLTLKQVIEIAVTKVHGIPIDVRNPMVRDRKPVADVIIVDGNQNVTTVTVDLLSGKTSIKK